MRIDAKLPEGYVILCTEACRGRSFLVRNLGLSVECPHCGKTSLTAHLVMDFIAETSRQAEEAAA